MKKIDRSQFKSYEEYEKFRQKEYYIANKEKIKAYNKENKKELYELYKKERPDLLKLINKSKYEKNKEKIKAYREKSAEKIRAYSSQIIKCCCGARVRRDGKTAHQKTAHHSNRMNNKNKLEQMLVDAGKMLHEMEIMKLETEKYERRFEIIIERSEEINRKIDAMPPGARLLFCSMGKLS